MFHWLNVPLKVFTSKSFHKYERVAMSLVIFTGLFFECFLNVGLLECGGGGDGQTDPVQQGRMSFV